MSSHQLPWKYPVLKAIAGVLADTSDGLTGREIGDLLPRLHMEDLLLTATKRDRLAEVFVARYLRHRAALPASTWEEDVRSRDRADHAEVVIASWAWHARILS